MAVAPPPCRPLLPQTPILAARGPGHKIAEPATSARTRKVIMTTRAMTNSTLAMVRAPAAMFVKPKMPATMDTRKKISAHFNIVHLPSVAASGCGAAQREERLRGDRVPLMRGGRDRADAC